MILGRACGKEGGPKFHRKKSKQKVSGSEPRTVHQFILVVLQSEDIYQLGNICRYEFLCE